MAIANYVVSQAPIVPSVNLDVIQNAADKIQQGSEKALELKSQLKSAIAELDLNEQEDSFRQKMLADIEEATNNGADIPYYSLPQLIKTKGDVFSNPGLIGRLRAQQAYKKFQDDIDKDPKLNDDVKRYAKFKNPYHYEDKFDDKGNVIGGSTWKPSYEPVESMDYNEMLKIAAQYAVPDSGGNVQTTFIDGNGNPTSNVTNAIGIFNTTTMRWEKLSDEKLLNGVLAARRANPKFDASLRQDWEVYNWMADNNEIEGNPIIKDSGSRKSFDEYISDMINPYIAARRYANSHSSTQYNAAGLETIRAIKVAKENQSRDVEALLDVISSNTSAGSHMYEFEDKTNEESFFTAFSIINNIAAMIGEYDSNYNLTELDLRNPDDLKQALSKSNIDDKKQNEIINNFKTLYYNNHDAFKTYNDILNNSSKESAAYIASIALRSGIKLSPALIKSNQYLKSYIDTIEKMTDDIYDGRNYVMFSTTNVDQYNDIIDSLGGKDNMKIMGYELKRFKNKYNIILNKDHSDQLYNFLNAAAIADTKLPNWHARSEFGSTDDGDNVNLKYYHLPHATALPAQNRDLPLNAESLFRRTFGRYMDKLVDDSINFALSNKRIEVESTAFPDGLYENLIPKYKELFDNLSNANSLLNTKVFVQKNDSPQFTEIDTGDKQAIVNILNNPSTKKYYSPVYLPNKGKIYTQVTIQLPKDIKNPFTKDSSPLIFTTEEFINNDTIDKINGNPYFVASSQLYNNSINGKDTTIGFYNKDDDGTGIIYMTPAYKTSNGTFVDIKNDNNSIIGSVSQKTAIDILSKYNQLKTVINSNVDNNIKIAEIANFVSDENVLKVYGKNILYDTIKILFNINIDGNQ